MDSFKFVYWNTNYFQNIQVFFSSSISLLPPQIIILVLVSLVLFTEYAMPLVLRHTTVSVNLARVVCLSRCVTTMTSRTKVFVNTTTQYVRSRRNPASSTLAAVNVSHVQFCSSVPQTVLSLQKSKFEMSVI